MTEEQFIRIDEKIMQVQKDICQLTEKISEHNNFNNRLTILETNANRNQNSVDTIVERIFKVVFIIFAGIIGYWLHGGK
jgi:hypothetical protein